VRYRDLDMMGHVNHAVIVTYFESARSSVMGQFERIPGSGFVLGEVHVRYLAEIRLGDAVEVGTRVTRIGARSFTLGQGLFVGERCAATCLGTEVHIDTATRRGAALPPAFLGVLERCR
jgi:acyl-CoA thioester hydrolase